jgi:hypothetical protein
MRFVVDTNVPVVANGRSEPPLQGAPSIACRISCVEFLLDLLQNHEILLDDTGLIQSEYSRHLRPQGQPGVGDRFYLEVINSHPSRISRFALPLSNDGEFHDLPVEIQNSNFDLSDRKFAALANKTGEKVVNATDSDWFIHEALLKRNGISVLFLCGVALFEN